MQFDQKNRSTWLEKKLIIMTVYLENARKLIIKINSKIKNSVRVEDIKLAFRNQ